MLRNLATSLLRQGRCETTVEKAKDLRPVVERLITRAGTDSVHARRLVFSYLRDKEAVHKLFTDIGPRFKARPGGYTRIIRSRVRHGDAAEMAWIELLKEEAKAAPAKKAPRGRAKKSQSSGAEAAAS